MLKTKFKLSSILIFIFIIACTANVNYVGKEFEPTTSVDIYFSADEIEKEYTIMGHALGSGGDFISNDEIQDKLIEVGKKKGADAILITGVEKSNIPAGGVSSDEKQIKASFIKYK